MLTKINCKIKEVSSREEEKSKGKKGSTLTIFFHQTILIAFSQSNHEPPAI
jgi:hypothetical protein